MKFAMAVVPRESAEGTSASSGIADGTIYETAYSALLSLGMSPVDARNRLDQVATSGQPCKTVEDVLNVVFRKP